MIFFRDQDLGRRSSWRWPSASARPSNIPSSRACPNYPLVLPVIKEPDERANFGGIWHTDTAYLERPALGDPALRAGDAAARRRHHVRQHVPGLRGALGGHAAPARRRCARSTSPARRSRSRPARRCMASAARAPTPKRSARCTRWCAPIPRPGARRSTSTRPHPRFEGMTEDESAPLLDYLFAHQMRPEFTCRFRWRPGSLAFWDNRASPALSAQRLSRPPPRDAPRVDRRRPPAVT